MQGTPQCSFELAVFKAQHGVTRTARSLGFCLKTKQERRHVTSCCSGGRISLCDIVRAKHSRKEWQTCRRQERELMKRWNSGCACVRGIPSVRDCNQLVVSTLLQQRAEAFIQEMISWLQLFPDIFLRFCSLGEMGPHSVVPCSAELQENSQNHIRWAHKQNGVENTADYEQWRRPVLAVPFLKPFNEEKLIFSIPFSVNGHADILSFIFINKKEDQYSSHPSQTTNLL